MMGALRFSIPLTMVFGRTFFQYVIPSVLSFALSGVNAIVGGFFRVGQQHIAATAAAVEYVGSAEAALLQQLVYVMLHA